MSVNWRPLQNVRAIFGLRTLPHRWESNLRPDGSFNFSPTSFPTPVSLSTLENELPTRTPQFLSLQIFKSRVQGFSIFRFGTLGICISLSQPSAMATAGLESLAVPRATHGVVLWSTRAASAPVPATLGCRAAALMPYFWGLKMAGRPAKVSAGERRLSTIVPRPKAVVCEAHNTAVNVPDVTKATWKSLVMDSDKPVLVEFWAPWCGPCRIILPVIAKLSKTYEDKLTCFKLNTDESPDIATQYGIRSIPTIIIFKSGEKKDAVIGAVPESTLITCIEKFV